MTDQEEPRPLPIAEAYKLRMCLICGANLAPISSKPEPCVICQHGLHLCDAHRRLAALRYRAEMGQVTDWPDTGIMHIRRMTSELGPVREMDNTRPLELLRSINWQVDVAVLLAGLDVQFEA